MGHKCKMIFPGYLGHTPLYVTSSVHLSICLPVHRTPYLRNHTSSNHDFWYAGVKLWYLQAFFHFFEILIFGLGGGGGGGVGKREPKMKNNNYIRHTPYLRNSIGYDHEFCYTCVK